MDWITLLESVATSVAPYADKFTISFSLTAGYILSRRFISFLNEHDHQHNHTKEILRKLDYIEQELERISGTHHDDEPCDEE